MNEFQIRDLSTTDAPEISKLLGQASEKDKGFFHPFAFDAESISTVVDSAVSDRFLGIYFNTELSAIFMLRGVDDGYSTPMFGVFVAPGMRRIGIGSLCINAAFTLCHLLGYSNIELKVNPENSRALALYTKLGFRESRLIGPQIILTKQLEYS